MPYPSRAPLRPPPPCCWRPCGPGPPWLHHHLRRRFLLRLGLHRRRRDVLHPAHSHPRAPPPLSSRPFTLATGRWSRRMEGYTEPTCEQTQVKQFAQVLPSLFNAGLVFSEYGSLNNGFIKLRRTAVFFANLHLNIVRIHMNSHTNP
jgi:hypothetical protein